MTDQPDLPLPRQQRARVSPRGLSVAALGRYRLFAADACGSCCCPERWDGHGLPFAGHGFGAVCRQHSFVGVVVSLGTFAVGVGAAWLVTMTRFPSW